MGHTSTQRPHLMHSFSSVWSVAMAMMPLLPLMMGTLVSLMGAPIMGPPILRVASSPVTPPQ